MLIKKYLETKQCVLITLHKSTIKNNSNTHYDTHKNKIKLSPAIFSKNG